MASRAAQKETVVRTGRELEASAPPQDAAQVSSQITTLNSLWQNVNKLSERKTVRLQGALKEVCKNLNQFCFNMLCGRLYNSYFV